MEKKVQKLEILFRRDSGIPAKSLSVVEKCGLD